MVKKPEVHQTVKKVEMAGREPPKRGRRWRVERAIFLSQHPLCACGCNRLAEEVDHIKPYADAPHLFWDWSNWQGLTKECHQQKTAAENAERNRPGGPGPRGALEGWADSNCSTSLAKSSSENVINRHGST